ncbi:MAG: hypothetical protein D4R40_00300 [Nitrosomonadaceae bacterium]|nr:MAG: hypothetical protein D4R40_00300 [Nitrosomonadaceae bacterium]
MAARRAQYGPNKLCKGRRFSALAHFTNQYRNLVNWVLIGAVGKFPPYERGLSS